MRRKIGERLRVGRAVADRRNRQVIAAALAIRANASRQPPDARMIEEQRFDRRLQHVDDRVVTTDVGDFVRQNRVDVSL